MRNNDRQRVRCLPERKPRCTKIEQNCLAIVSPNEDILWFDIAMKKPGAMHNL
jgi:hypothetical protein